MNDKTKNPDSLILNGFANFIEFGNRWFTLSGLFFKSNKNVFIKVEIMMLVTTVLSVSALFLIEHLSFVGGLIICVLLLQRVIEYFFVYLRNFILNKGRVFTDFVNKNSRSQWLILMFLLNLFQLNIIFATWFHFLSIHNPATFSKTLNILDSVYFSFITFLTIGYGDILPVSPLAKVLSLLEGGVSYYTLIIVINGLISLHFKGENNETH